MNGFSLEKLNKRRNMLSFLVAVLVAVFSVNLALVDDPMIFVIFYTVAAAAGAYLLKAKGAVITLSAAFLGWAVAFMVTKNALLALLSISYLPFSITVPFIGKDRLTRSGAIGIASASVTLGFVACILYLTYVRVGSVSISAVRSAFPYFFNEVSELLYGSFFVTVAGSEVSLIAESNVTGYLNVIICLIPATLSALFNLLGYLIAWLYKKLVESTATAEINQASWLLLPSPVTAGFFLTAFIAVMIFDAVDLLSLTALNIFIILLPVILLTGLLTSLTPKVTNGVARPRLLRPLTLIISVFNGIVPFASLCIIYGIFDSFKASFSGRKPKKQE